MTMTLKLGDRGDTVKLLQRALSIVIAPIDVDGEFGSLETLPAVQAFQRARGLAPTGVVDAATWAELARAVPAEFPEHTIADVADDRLRAAGQRALDEALRLWQSDVYDPLANDKSERANRSRDTISELLAACGWTWQVPYRGDGQVEWCGIFAGACWRAAGLDPRWLATYFASTYRLDLWGSYREFDPRHPNPAPTSGSRRLMAVLDAHSTSLPFEPRAGDVLMIGDGMPAPGDHICVVIDYNPSTRHFATVEGNGVGLGPDGKRRQGIVRASRPLGGLGYCARRLIRPAATDLIAP